MTPEQLKDKVINEFFKDYTTEEVQRDVKILSTLGLIEPDFDLRQFYLDLYSEQIAGYYDSETKEMYVISGEGFGGMERMTYAHEFNHVLQDQSYDMEKGLKLNSDDCEDATEYCAAVTALIEGDSTLSEQLWFFQNGTSQDQSDLQAFQANYSSPVYDSAPEYMKSDFLFPYSQGYAFVEALYSKNRWKSVDAAYQNLPQTTEQILHPEKYPKDLPVTVDMPDFSTALGTGWSELDRNVMGEWYTYLILGKGRDSQFTMPDDASKAAAAGWGGDTYVFYAPENSEDYMFAWQSKWDSSTDANEFYDLSIDYGMARWGIPEKKADNQVTWSSDTDGMVTIRRTATDVLWLMGSQEDVINIALPLLPEFME